MKKDFEYSWKNWEQMSKDELYAILHLRQEVFVIEQKAIYQQVDYLDQIAQHILVTNESDIVAHARLFVPGTKSEESQISGICVRKSHRKRGIGQELIRLRLNFLKENYANIPIKTSVQQYRVAEYENIGFSQSGKPEIYQDEIYVDDPIYHVELTLTPDNF